MPCSKQKRRVVKINAMTLSYLILGIISIIAFLIFILKIAGQDMMFALYRYFNPRGCDIFITNSNRHVDRYYKEAKDGTFKIKGNTYITNPHKLEGLGDEMKKEVKDKLSIKYNRLKNNIQKFENKKEIVLKKIRSLEEKEANIPILDNLNLQLNTIQENIDTFKSKLKEREQAYYMQRRACYFYIECDPVPKDFWEWRTDIDTVQLDNIILRAQTKDPKGVDLIGKDVLFIKKFVLICLGGICILAFLLLKNGTYIQQVGQHLGVVFRLG